MPCKTKAAVVAAEAALPSIPKELIDQFVTGPMSAQAVNTAATAFKKALIERALGAELSHHLGYPPGSSKPEPATNHRNGRSAKTVLTEDGALSIEVPRDRDGSFEPPLFPKHERRFTGFDDKVVAMYARGDDGARDLGNSAPPLGRQVHSQLADRLAPPSVCSAPLGCSLPQHLHRVLASRAIELEALPNQLAHCTIECRR